MGGRGQKRKHKDEKNDEKGSNKREKKDLELSLDYLEGLEPLFDRGPTQIYEHEEKYIYKVTELNLNTEFNNNIGEFEREVKTLGKLQKMCGNRIICMVHHYKQKNHSKEKDYYGIIVFEKFSSVTDMITFSEQPQEFPILIKAYENLILGLQVLHENGVAHLDIKPDNVLINAENGDIMYIDFGSSCSEEKDCPTKFGTKKYHSPEHHHTRKTMKQWQKIDIYNLGRLFHAMVFSNYRNIEHYNSDIFRVLELARKLMCDNPDDRIDLATALDDIREIQTSV
jgi:serine/threonine protein kinase